MLVILLWAITVFGSGWREWSKGIYLLFAIFMWGACLWSAIWFLRMCHYMYLYPDHLVCKCPFRKSFVLYYDRCIVGMDYATTTGTTRWWIYLSYGPLPKYKGKSPANRINSLRTKPGFVCIQFSFMRKCMRRCFRYSPSIRKSACNPRIICIAGTNSRRT